MNSVHRHMLNIYNGIYVAAMSITIQMLIGTYTGTGYMYGLLAVSVLVTGTGLEYLSSAGQGTRRKAIIIMILGCVALACITVAGLFAEGLSARVLPGYSAAEGELVLPFAYRLSVTIISAVFITLLCEIILRIPFISGIAPCFLIIFIIGSRISGVIVELEVFILALYVFIITVCKAGRDVHYMYMTPVIMIFCTMLYIIPTGTEPMSWNNVWKVIDTAGRSISDVWMDVMEATGLDRLDGNVRRIGYSDSEDIDIVDEIVGNNRTQLTVTGRQCASSIYLRGSYYNEYNGSGWQRNYSDKSYPEYEVMLFETLNNMLNFGEDNPKTIYNNISKITIQYKSLRTDNVFVPYNTVRKEMNNDTEYDNGVLKFTNSAKEGDSYKIWYFNMREDAKEAVYGSNGWEQYNKALDIVRYADMYADCNLIGNIDNILVQDIDDLLAGRKEYVKDNYMNIPECVPERVYKLAKDITANAPTKYKKVKRIEEYLNTNYKYNKKVTRTSAFGNKNECSVDDFLFNTKEGSCMHFASALAVLARCIGIPSRITTGYCMRYNDATGKWVEHFVVGGEGHAWPEVYVGVSGWMRLDPTPAYYEKAYIDDGLNEKDKENLQSGSRGSRDTIYEENGENMLPEKSEASDDEGTLYSPVPSSDKNNNRNGNHNSAAPGNDTKQTGTNLPDDGTTGTGGSRQMPVFIICIIMLICIAGIVIRIRMKNLYYANSGNSGKCGKVIDEIMHRYIKDMKRAGKRTELGNCTLNESADIMSEWLGDERGNYEKLVDTYQGKVFGGIRIDRNAVRQAEALLSRLKRRKYKSKR